MKKESLFLNYDFYGRKHEYLIKDHTKYAREFLKDEYGIKEENLEKLIADFDLVYLLEDNQQYLGILHKVFYEDALEDYRKEIEE